MSKRRRGSRRQRKGNRRGLRRHVQRRRRPLKQRGGFLGPMLRGIMGGTAKVLHSIKVPRR